MTFYGICLKGWRTLVAHAFVIPMSVLIVLGVVLKAWFSLWLLTIIFGPLTMAVFFLWLIMQYWPKDKNVFYHKGGSIYEDGSDGWQKRGWYFWDETQAHYYGPYLNYLGAKWAMKDYAKTL